MSIVSHIIHIMNISRFRMNGNAVLDAVPLTVVRRGRPFLRVRLYRHIEDAAFEHQPWCVVCARSGNDWLEFFKRAVAQAVTLDSVPSFVVEQWSDDDTG